MITAGPSGRVGSASAVFEFSIPSTDPGKYQCRIDQGPWQDDCKSPKEYSDLADGEHTFDVRFYGPGEDPDTAPIASRTWTSDTTPPEAIIDQAPSGTTTSTDATIAFHSTEPDGATFLCSQDGGPEFDCSSPERLAGLGDGAHTFAVRAIDDVGNEQQSPTRVSWQVTEPSSGGGSGGGGGGSSGGGGGGSTGGTTPPPTPTSDCSGGRFTKLAVGSVVAVGRGDYLLRADAQGRREFRLDSRGPISLNGIELVPSGVIRFDQTLGKLVMDMPAGTTMGFRSFNWPMPVAVKVDLTSHFPMPNPSGKFTIAGLNVAAEPDFTLSTADGGSATVSVNLELPEIFTGTAGEESDQPPGEASTAPPGDGSEEPQGAHGLTIAFKFIASNQKGVRFASKASLSSAWLFGKVKISKLTVGLDTGPPVTFDGSAILSFPGVDGKFTIGVGFSTDGAQSFHHVTKLALEASELQKPIAEGLFLQRLGGSFSSCVGTDKQVGGQLTASAGVSVGPRVKIPPILDGEPISLDGTATLSLCEPESVNITGAGKIVEVPIGNVRAKYVWSTGRIDLTGNLGYSVGGFGFQASVTNAFVDVPHDTWNVAATGQLRLPYITGGVLNGEGDVVLSSNGLAACFGSPGARYGIAKHWGEDLQTFSNSCDVGPYSASAAAARAASAESFSVRPHERLKVIARSRRGRAAEGVAERPRRRADHRARRWLRTHDVARRAGPGPDYQYDLRGLVLAERRPVVRDARARNAGAGVDPHRRCPAGGSDQGPHQRLRRAPRPRLEAAPAAWPTCAVRAARSRRRSGDRDHHTGARSHPFHAHRGRRQGANGGRVRHPGRTPAQPVRRRALQSSRPGATARRRQAAPARYDVALARTIRRRQLFDDVGHGQRRDSLHRDSAHVTAGAAVDARAHPDGDDQRTRFGGSAGTGADGHRAPLVSGARPR